MPVRCLPAVIDAPGNERLVAVAIEERHNDFFADARYVYTAVPTTSMRLRDAHPARRVFIAGVQPVPVHLHLDAVQRIREDFLVRRANHSCSLHMHLGLLMLEWATERDGLALCFDHRHEETFAAVCRFDD